VQVVLRRAVQPRAREGGELDVVDEQAEEHLQYVEHDHRDADFRVRVGDLDAHGELVFRLGAVCPAGEDDGTRDKELDDPVGPIPSALTEMRTEVMIRRLKSGLPNGEGARVARDEDADRKKNKETN
jgi:hypothetical protein